MASSKREAWFVGVLGTGLAVASLVSAATNMTGIAPVAGATERLAPIAHTVNKHSGSLRTGVQP